MIQLAEKVILITGANGGLGNFMTEGFLKAGATVIGVARSIQPSAFVHAKFVALPADLTRDDSTKSLVGTVIARFGKIDVLVHVLGGFAGGDLIEDSGKFGVQLGRRRRFDVEDGGEDLDGVDAGEGRNRTLDQGHHGKGAKAAGVYPRHSGQGQQAER